MRTLYEEITAGVGELHLQVPAVDFDRFQQLLETVEHEHVAQNETMKRLRRDYQFVYDYINTVCSPTSPNVCSALRSASTVRSSSSVTTTGGSPAGVGCASLLTAALAQVGRSSPAPPPTPSTPSTPSTPPTPPTPSTPSTPQQQQQEGSREHSAACTPSDRTERGGGSGSKVTPRSSNTTTNTTTAIANTEGLSVDASVIAVSVHADTDSIMRELQRRKNAQEGGHIIDVMAQRSKTVKEAKNELERSQNWLVRSVYRIMRQIALLQTDIRHKLRKDVDWMKRLTAGRNEYFDHLSQIEKLPNVYNSLLNEIVRRRSYISLFESEVICCF